MNEQQIAKRIDKALSYRTKGQDEKALEILLSVENDNDHYRDEALVLCLIAGTYQLMIEYALALPYFDKCLAAKPKSVVASTGKFHCLTGLDRHEEALEEMKQFLSTHTPKKDNYKWIIEDLIHANFEHDVIKPYKSFIFQKAKEFGLI
jgi:tetratricopeptide (TPR) repeat protein